MRRLHVHLSVDDLDASVTFYSALFGRQPDKREPDYAKWLLDDPQANIAISTKAAGKGVSHLGVQVDDDDELELLSARLTAAGSPPAPEKDATCCYARSNKYWAQSPEGARWELFNTFGESAEYGVTPTIAAAAPATTSCCG